MIKLSYSQSIYPKKTIIENDTLVIITIKQVDQINLMYEENRMLHSKYSILDSVFSEYLKESQKKDSIHDKIYLDNLEIVEANKKIQYRNSKLEEKIEKEKKRKKWYIIGGIVTGIAIRSFIK